ncbi:MAG: hypothetical protein HC835_16595 [Oscillatoriales cyanobacterium RM2_1_1]|nr:hypothetical protein [Oscillatoriales cyanobacterium SM2_3_0]NJO47105.1 hypothetical protein [Oscillatoriales cyanobacterium RM2_1_1]
MNGSRRDFSLAAIIDSVIDSAVLPVSQQVYIYTTEYLHHRIFSLFDGCSLE